MTWPGSSFHSLAGRQTRHEGFRVSLSPSLSPAGRRCLRSYHCQNHGFLYHHTRYGLDLTGTTRRQYRCCRHHSLRSTFPSPLFTSLPFIRLAPQSSQEAPYLMDNVLQHLRTWVSSTSSSFQFIHATDNSLVDKSRIGHWHWQWTDHSCFFSAFYYHWRSFSNRLQDTTSPSTGRRARSYSHIAT